MRGPSPCASEPPWDCEEENHGLSPFGVLTSHFLHFSNEFFLGLGVFALRSVPSRDGLVNCDHTPSKLFPDSISSLGFSDFFFVSPIPGEVDLSP